jgi:type II secretory pathway pseudopilin PulG
MRRSHRGREPRPAEAGLTLIEVLVAVLLLGLVVGGLLPLLTGGTQGSAAVGRRQAMIQNARVALDKLVREMRAAESLRIVSPGLIAFTLFWGDGTGAEPTVEYSLDSATHTLDYAWIADYDYREQITVRARDAVAAGYAVALTLNHAALVAAGKSQASGDDVRVRYWTGSAWVELDRVLDPTSAWNTTTTKIWFRLQAPIAANATDSSYYLYYGNLADGAPPARGDNVFLDYQDGTTLDGWTRRDNLPGTTSTSATDGFVFQASSGTGYRELTKNVPNSDVEIFWGFWSATTDAQNGHDTGVSARLSDTGAGYRLTVGDPNNQFLRIHYWTAWGGTGGVIGSVKATTVPGHDYFGRFYLVGSSLQAKYWDATTQEPAGWMLSTTDTSVASGNHFGQVDGSSTPEDHRHRTLIIRPRVALEPVVSLGPETSGARPDPLQPLAGPFRSLGVACFDGSGASVPCSQVTAVRQVQVSLVAMDPTGATPDITVTEQAAPRTP